MSFLAVAGLLGLVLILLFVVILRPAQKADHLGAVAVVALGLALGIGGVEGLGQISLASLLLALVILALAPAVAITRGFGRVDMLALLFHRDFGVKGADLRSFKNEIAIAGITAALLWLAAVRLDWHLGAGQGLVFAVGLAVLAANPFLRFFLQRLWVGKVQSVLPERLVPPSLRSGPVATPDLVVIYLEGTDRRFADPAVFGSIYSRLSAFAAAGISFTRVGQIVGTGWSSAGAAASQGGVVLPARGMKFKVGLEKVQRFMPGVTYLGDILAAKSYSSRFIVGGDTRFGGLGALYTTHGIPTTGWDEIGRMFPAEEVKAARVSWYLDDQMTLDAARRVHSDLVLQPNPMALFVETVAPHGPKGYLSRRSTASGRAEETPNFGFTVKSMIDEVLEFIDDLRAASTAHGRDLRVVLLSDHLNHTVALPTGGPGYAGFNTVIFWGDGLAGGAGPAREVDRLGSMVDVYPTLLDWLGWSEKPVAAGLGRSLLSDAPTLVEEFGIRGLDAMIVADPRLGARLWAEDPPEAQHSPKPSGI